MRAQIDTLDIISGNSDEWFKATEKDIMACSNAKMIRFI